MPSTRRAFLGMAAAIAATRPAVAAEPYALLGPDQLAAVRGTSASLRGSLTRWADRHLDAPSKARESVHVEGGIAGRGDYDASAEALRELSAIRELALASAFGNEGYAAKAAALLARWLEIYRPNFNPIDETAFENLFVAWDALPEAARAPHAARYAAFARGFAQGYLDRLPGLRGNTAINNWHSHRVKIMALAAFATGDTRLIGEVRAAFDAHLARTLIPDGPSNDFAERDAIHYVVYNLLPLCTACLAAKTHGQDWYATRATNGATIAGSLNWTLPYATGEKTHAEFERSKVRFDFERRNAGVAGFKGDFEPAKARDLFVVAARLDSRFWPIARKLQPGNIWYDAPFPRAAA
jgi:hypothetical protein